MSSDVNDFELRSYQHQHTSEVPVSSAKILYDRDSDDLQMKASLFKGAVQIASISF